MKTGTTPTLLTFLTKEFIKTWRILLKKAQKNWRCILTKKIKRAETDISNSQFNFNLVATMKKFNGFSYTNHVLLLFLLLIVHQLLMAQGTPAALFETDDVLTLKLSGNIKELFNDR